MHTAFDLEAVLLIRHSLNYRTLVLYFNLNPFAAVLTKLQAKVFFLGGTAVFFGIFLVLSIDTHLKVPRPDVKSRISRPPSAAGKRIWEQNNCMGCHTLFGEGCLLRA
jgi:hypothetical protein